MRRREKLRAKTQAFLPGEVVHEAFQAFTWNPYLGLIWAIATYAGGVRIVAVTTDRFVVFRCRRVRFTRPAGILRSLPRQTRVGPPHGFLWFRSNALGERLYMYRLDFAALRRLRGPPPVSPTDT